MEIIEGGSIQLELKYCERCGALWLRPKGSELVFCAPCTLAMAGLAPRARGFGQHRCTVSENVIVDPAFWTEGGNA
jgi:hypothetical protein